MPRLRAGALAAALCTALIGAGCSGGGGASDEAGAPVEREVILTTTTSTTEAPLTGKPLVVMEQGVSSFPDPYDPSSSLGGYGVILGNPNRDLLATGVRVTTRILDAEGAELLVDSTLLNAVMPAARMALGRTLIEPIEDPTTLDVRVEVTAWLRPAHASGGIVAEGVVTESEDDGGAATHFTVRSTWPDTEEGVDVTAVYRAADGRILGAESTTLPTVPANKAIEGRIRLLSPIPDLVTTEVFVGRGIAAQTTG